MAVKGRQLTVQPAQIENRVDAPHQMISGHQIIKVNIIKQTILITIRPTHHRNDLRDYPQTKESRGHKISNRVLQQNLIGKQTTENTPNEDWIGSTITVFFAVTTVLQSGDDRKSMHKFQTSAENVVCAPNTGKANLGFKTGKIDPKRS